jgi:hypothetical protein
MQQMMTSEKRLEHEYEILKRLRDEKRHEREIFEREKRVVKIVFWFIRQLILIELSRNQINRFLNDVAIDIILNEFDEKTEKIDWLKINLKFDLFTSHFCFVRSNSAQSAHRVE